MFNLILCKDTNKIIGINNELYIKIRKDMEYFTKITTKQYSNKENIIVMGYNTWNSIPLNYRPLKNRKNIVITRNHNLEFNDIDTFVTIDNFIEWYQKNISNYGNVFIIGGEKIYNEFMNKYSDMISKLYITEVENKYIDISKIENVKTFNHDLHNFKLINSEKLSSEGYEYDFGLESKLLKEFTYSFNEFKNIKHINIEEDNYLNVMNDILNPENIKNSRNSEVYSKFGIRMEFDLTETFPLLTTKRVGWKTILRELLWFISGSTDNKKLIKNKVNIWTQNADDYNTKSNYNDGDLGPVYGFQWRHFGATYNGCSENYDNKGIDQLKYIIDEIKSNPSSRRLILSSWNPVDIPNMALPPCHVLVQFNIQDTFIDCQLYQRSGDMFLGVPFNIASYGFLLHIVGSLTNYKPRKLIHIIGDAHIYKSHYNAVKEQLSRTSLGFPVLKVKKMDDIDKINEDMFSIHNYNPSASIRAPMIT